MDQIVWTFDRLTGIGGAETHLEGHPELIATPAGKALLFNGVDDALVIDTHPLAGASTFTIEAVFRPEGKAFEQRWLHLAQHDPVKGDAQSPRILFEIRVVAGAWYLDAFTTGEGYNQTLVAPEKTFPLGRWYAVQQSFDGTFYRSFVNGVLQAEAITAFKPHGPGRTSVGMRINRISHFNGAILNARFTRGALAPAKFTALPDGLNAG